MFSSLKLNSFKCQSSGSDGNKDKCEDEDEPTGSGDHTYEKLAGLHGNPCECRLSHGGTSKTPFSKRISKWKMECSGINAYSEYDSSNCLEGTVRETLHPGKERLVKTKIMTVNIRREDGNLGITLRGGFHQNADSMRPVVITDLRPDGPAAREGTIKAGDRLLAVDGVSLRGRSLSEAQTLLRQPSSYTALTIEYDVGVLDSVEHANGPLLVEVERKETQQLGLTLLQDDRRVIIERVRPGSLADRCGALHVGDEILAVNSTRIGGCSVALEDVMKILDCEYPMVRLEILPASAASCYSNYATWRTKDHGVLFDSTFSSVGTIKGHKNQIYPKEESENGIDCKANCTHTHSICGKEIALTHCETIHITLTREGGSFGLEFVDSPDGSVLIGSLVPGGPAERCQCLHSGDRVLAVNHRSVTLDNLSARDINDLLEHKSDENSFSKLSLHTEFDVLETVVPASGIFTVKLVKRGSGGLGITMMASKSSGFIICEMKKGSIAHRAGSLIPGDRLLAINNVPLDHCSAEYAAHILHHSSNIVSLKVQREDNSAIGGSRKVTYTVDLQRYGGPLGITIAGSEEPFQPITISGLTAGGLADQTGVIHVGDEILAINNHSLYGEPLSKAHILLQSSSDLVTLKISRSIVPNCRPFGNRSPILPSSIDSAVESWDSSHLDLVTPSDYPKNLREPKEKCEETCDSLERLPIQGNGFPKSVTEKPPSTSKNENHYSDLAILDEITSENLKIRQELDMLSIKLDEQRKSKLQDNLEAGNIFPMAKVFSANTSNLEVQGSENNNSYNNTGLAETSSREVDVDCKGRESFVTNDFDKFEMTFMPETRNWCKNQYLGGDNNKETIGSEFHSSQLHEVVLYKDPIYEDFGFSVSDGLYERGVFINRIRKGGPADLSNVLKPYDRILQVNDTYTQDFDCCLTVPLIASAENSLVLLVARNPENCISEKNGFGEEKHNQEPAASILGNHDELKRISV